jgi:hypothetical protein
MDWTDEPIDFRVWKRVPGHPFADYDPADGIALWSLWEMPSCSVGKLVRRGRPRGELTTVRSIRLLVVTWKRLEQEAKRAHTTVNALVAARIGEGRKTSRPVTSKTKRPNSGSRAPAARPRQTRQRRNA